MEIALYFLSFLFIISFFIFIHVRKFLFKDFKRLADNLDRLF